jgi:hypothetical protein
MSERIARVQMPDGSIREARIEVPESMSAAAPGSAQPNDFEGNYRSKWDMEPMLSNTAHSAWNTPLSKELGGMSTPASLLGMAGGALANGAGRLMSGAVPSRQAIGGAIQTAGKFIRNPTQIPGKAVEGVGKMIAGSRPPVSAPPGNAAAELAKRLGTVSDEEMQAILRAQQYKSGPR